MEKFYTGTFRKIFEELKQHLVGGVASSFQVPNYAEYAIVMTHGKGSKLYDGQIRKWVQYAGEKTMD